MKTIYCSILLIIATLTTKTAFAGDSYNYTNPLIGGASDINSFSDLAIHALTTVQGIVGFLAVLMLIISGIMYMLSGVSSKQLELAKSMATWSIVGFTIAIAAPSLLKEIYEIAGGPAGDPLIITNARGFKDILLIVLDFFLMTIGILAAISFTIGGYLYLSAASDQNQAEKAKKVILYSIIAVLVSGSGIIIIRQIITILEAV